MEKIRGNSISLLKSIALMYFSKLMIINQELESSIIFVLSVQFLRFILGHSQIFCIFMLELVQKDSNYDFFHGLKDFFVKHSLQNYEYLKIACIVILGIQVIYIIMFTLNEQIQRKCKMVRILYFILKYMKISSQLWFSIFSVVFYVAVQKQQYQMIMCLIVQIVLTLLLFKITPVFEQRNNFQSHDAYVHRENLAVELTNLFFCVLTFAGTFFVMAEVSDFVRIALVVLWIGNQLLRIRFTVVETYYQNQSTNTLYCFVTCLQTVQILIYTILDLTRLELVSNNTTLLIILITIFFFWSAHNFDTYMKQSCYFWEIDQLKSNQQIYFVINAYYVALKSIETYNNFSQIGLVVSSIRRNHQNSCKNTNCYCYTQKQLQTFLKHYIFQMIKKLQEINSHNHLIMLYIYSFKFHVFQHYTKVHEQIQMFQKAKQMGYFESLLAMTLKYKIKKWVDHSNRDRDVIAICLAIRLEEDMNVLNDIVIDDIEVKYRKWNAFMKEISSVKEIREMSKQQLQNLIQIQDIKKQKWSKYNRSPAFNCLLYFYFKRVTFKNDDLGQIEQNIKDLSRKVKEQQLSKPSLFTKHLFHKNSCTIESSMKQGSLGVILNASKSMFKVFGYANRRILGQNMSSLLPHFLVEEHEILMESWLRDGGDLASISTITQSYCLHKQNYSFIALKYMKVYATFEQVTLITAFFKKSQIDLVLIDEKGRLQSYGKTFQGILKGVPQKIQADFVFRDIMRKISNADMSEQKHQRTVIYDQNTINDFVNGDKPQDFSQNVLIDPNSPNRHFLHGDTTIQFEDMWRMNFKYTKARFGSKVFFRIQVRGMQYIKKYDEKMAKSRDTKEIGSDLGHDMDIASKQVTDQAQLKIMQIAEQQNSSMTSFSSQLGYSIYKLIAHFSYILLNPAKLTDKRMRRKMISDVGFLFLLITLISATLVINKFSLQDKICQLKAKSNIDRVFHLLQLLTNHVYNLHMYRDDVTAQRIAFDELEWDSNSFIEQLNRQFQVINEQISPFKKEVLYDYLQSSLDWTFKNGTKIQVDLLQLLQLTLFLCTDIKNNVFDMTINQTIKKESYYLLTQNIHQLRQIRESLSEMKQITLNSDDKFNTDILIALILVFSFVSGAFCLYLNSYREYRFSQIQDHVKIYLMMPNQLIKNLAEYYTLYYKHYVLGKVRIDVSLMNQGSQISEQQLQQNQQNQQLSSNKIKFVGREKYLYWIIILMLFLVMNGGNFIIAYNMYKFNKEYVFFYKLTNCIAQSQSVLLTRLIRLKSRYYFNKEGLNLEFMNQMLLKVEISQVNFTHYVTFDKNWVTQSDPNFRQQFNKILTESPCELHKNTITPRQLAICKQQTVLSKNGIITFVNGFSRFIRNTYLHLSKDLDFYLSKYNYLAEQKQFRQYDFATTFHIPTFTMLNQKIISVYQSGFNQQYQQCLVIFVFLILLLVGIYVGSWFRFRQERKDMSILYGYILLFPPGSIKQSKYLIKFIQQNLQFTDKH